MANYIGLGRCLICRRATLENSPINHENLASNVSLLHKFLNCFNIKVLDSKVNDLSTSCQFCETCEQFISEWSSIQTQMAQLTPRAAQLEATLSALLLSAPDIHKPNHQDNVNQIINNRMQSSQEVELPLLLQQTVDDIRNELRRKYSVRVMLDKIQPHSILKVEPLSVDDDNNAECWNPWEYGEIAQLPFVPKIEPLSSVGENNDDESWGHWEFGADDSDEEHLPGQDPLNYEVTPGKFVEVKIESKEGDNCDYSNVQVSANSKETNVKTRSSKTNRSPKRKRKRQARKATINPDGPNRFRYKGMPFQLNDEDQTYTCDACGFKSGPNILSIHTHIIRHINGSGFQTRRVARVNINTNECPSRPSRSKVKRTPYPKFKTIIPDGPNRFVFKGISFERNEENQTYTCDACGFKSGPDMVSIRCHIINHFIPIEETQPQSLVIPDGPNRFKFKGHDFMFNDDDECFYCGICKYRGHTTVQSILAHFQRSHENAEEKSKGLCSSYV